MCVRRFCIDANAVAIGLSVGAGALARLTGLWLTASVATRTTMRNRGFCIDANAAALGESVEASALTRLTGLWLAASLAASATMCVRRFCIDALPVALDLAYRTIARLTRPSNAGLRSHTSLAASATMRNRSFCVHTSTRAKFLSRRAIALTTSSVDTRLSLRTIGVLLTSALVVDQAVAIVVFLVTDLCAWCDRALALAPNVFHAFLCSSGTFADSLVL